MCIVFGAFAHRCPAVVGPLELLPQNSVEVASVSELELVEGGPDLQTWARSGGMQRLDNQKVVELPTFCQLEALKVFVFQCFWRTWRPKNIGILHVLEVEAAKLLVL